MESLKQLVGQALIEENSYAVVVTDVDQRIRFVNQAAERIFRYSAEALAGQPLDLLIPPAYRQDHRSHVRFFLAEGARGRSMGDRGEIYGQRGNGETFPAEATITSVSWHGVTYLAALINDRSAAKALEAERQRLAEILEATPDFVGMADPQGNVLYRNQGAQKLLGVEGSWQEQTSHISNTHPPEEARRILEEALPAARQSGTWEGETRLLDRDGNIVPISQIIQAHYDDNGEVAYFSTIARDLRPYREAEQRLRTLFSALDQAADMVWITDTQGTVDYVNPAFEAMTGYNAQEAQGRPVGALMKSGSHDRTFYERMWSQLQAGQTYRDVFTNLTRDGHQVEIDETITPVQDAEGAITHFIATGRDITERLALEDRLRQLAYYDSLTGLPNRTHFEEHLGHSLARADRTRQSLALIMLDLDRFKDINDSLGHAAGDELLTLVGQGLSETLRSADLVARWGGDEFVILLDPVGDKKDVEKVADKVRQALETSFTIQGTSFRTHISMGISFFPDDARDMATLLQQADTALFEAKRSAGTSYRFFSPQHSEAATHRFEGERNLQQALADETCAPFFQAIVDLPTGAIVGVEALARCQLPTRDGWMPPDQFIPVAERTGLIHQLGAQILHKAWRQFQQWRNAGYDLERLSVNLSPVQLASDTFSLLVAEMFEERGGDPGWLELEVTEEAALWEESRALKVLEELNELGVTIALDDFGKGYSSPAHLQQLPVSRMKIDRAFIQDVDREAGNQTILKGLLGFAEGFGCRITAEGVERPEEASHLQNLGIREAQGFLFGHPLPAEAFEKTHLIQRP